MLMADDRDVALWPGLGCGGRVTSARRVAALSSSPAVLPCRWTICRVLLVCGLPCCQSKMVFRMSPMAWSSSSMACQILLAAR